MVVIKIVILEYVCDYVCVVLWYNGVSVIMLGGKYIFMLFGDLVIINVNDDVIKVIYYCIVVNILIGEKYFSNLVKLFLKGKNVVVELEVMLVRWFIL